MAEVLDRKISSALRLKMLETAAENAGKQSLAGGILQRDNSVVQNLTINFNMTSSDENKHVNQQQLQVNTESRRVV